MKQRFAFAIDTTGGEITSAVLPQLRYDGRSAICGRAAGITLETTVLPFILRGVHLLGIDSVNVGMDKRKIVWQRLATDLDITEKAVYQEITLEELPLFLKHYKQANILTDHCPNFLRRRFDYGCFSYCWRNVRTD